MCWKKKNLFENILLLKDQKFVSIPELFTETIKLNAPPRFTIPQEHNVRGECSVAEGHRIQALGPYQLGCGSTSFTSSLSDFGKVLDLCVFEFPHLENRDEDE